MTDHMVECTVHRFLMAFQIPISPIKKIQFNAGSYVPWVPEVIFFFFLTSEAIDIHSCNTLRGLWNQGGSCVNGPILKKWFSRALSAIVFDKREDFRFLSRHFRKFPNLTLAIRSINRFKVLTLGRAT